MASKDTTKELLELFQKCKEGGESATFFMETMNGKDTTITFKVKSAGPQPDASSGIFQNSKRWETPSQLKLEKQKPANDLSMKKNVGELMKPESEN